MGEDCFPRIERKEPPPMIETNEAMPTETAESRGPLDDKPPELGSEAVQILEGSTFAVSDAAGDMPPGVAGFFHRDTRHVSEWVLTIGGQKPTVLTSGPVDYFS